MSKINFIFCCLCLMMLTPTLISLSSQAEAQSAEPRDERLWQMALRIHRAAIVIDTHNDITSAMVDENYDLATPSPGKYHTDLLRMQTGGITGEFFSIYVDQKYAKEGGSARRAMDMIDKVYRQAELYPDKLVMAYSVADIRRAKKQGKIAALMGIEGGHAIENSLMALRNFYRLGIRYITLTHNNTNDWADASRDTARHNGLSNFGKEVVGEMNRLGMLVDISHVADKTMQDVLEISRAPVIASHSSVRALADSPRNIPDDLLRGIAKNGGVVMINFFPGFIDQKVVDANKERMARLAPKLNALREEFKSDPQRLQQETRALFAANPLPTTPLSVLIDHIEHVIKVAGIDHVGLGSDFDGIPSLPVGMEDIAQLPNITYELLKRGYKEPEIRKVLGENFLRAFSKAEQIAEINKRTVSAQGSLARLPE
jgi:membrane dipeptidase